MRLVISYTISDDCTYSFNNIVPVEYESAEAFIVEFEEICRETFENSRCEFTFAGREWRCTDFVFFQGREKYYNPPTIKTVDEWFSTYK